MGHGFHFSSFIHFGSIFRGKGPGAVEDAARGASQQCGHLAEQRGHVSDGKKLDFWVSF